MLSTAAQQKIAAEKGFYRRMTLKVIEGDRSQRY